MDLALAGVADANFSEQPWQHRSEAVELPLLAGLVAPDLADAPEPLAWGLAVYAVRHHPTLGVTLPVTARQVLRGTTWKPRHTRPLGS